FNKLETVDDNTSLISNHRINTNISTVEDLIAQGLVSRRSYDSIEVFPGNSYLTVNALNPIYGVTNNDGPSRNEFEFRKIAFELLAEKGYENGFVPYLSNQYQSELGQIDSAGRISDNQLISKITDGVYADSKDFRKEMFKRRKEKLDQLKPITVVGQGHQHGNGYFYGSTRELKGIKDIRELMQAAVE
ncbi:ZmpA/ZmpB/ZmpC family metallo-endopeptidase, partial [Streptococcus suis]